MPFCNAVGLLGGRNVSKRYLIRLVFDHLVRMQVPVAVAAFLDDEADVNNRGSGADRFLGDIPGLLRDPEATLKWWQEHHQSGCLMIANIDAIPAGAHRQFCQELNQIGMSGILVTCEAHGAKSLAISSPTLPVQTVFVISSLEISNLADSPSAI